jgi:arylsulfatase A-like enzyme
MVLVMVSGSSDAGAITGRSRRAVATWTASVLVAAAWALAAAGALAPASGGAYGTSLEHASVEAVRPNVLLILTDDQTLADMRVLGSVGRRIGATGTTFTSAFSQYPLCCPARATILTGQHAHNHGVMGNAAPHGGFEAFDDRESLPVWLQRAGYNTIMLGKYLNEYDGSEQPRRYVPPGWTEWQVPVVGAYNFRRYTMNENRVLRRYDRYQTDHWRRRGAALVTRYAARDKPFFMWVGFLAPHSGGPVEADDPQAVTGSTEALRTPAVAAEFRNAMKDVALPEKPSFLEADMSDKPSMRLLAVRPAWEFREAYRQRLESLMSVNKAINGLLDALQASGEAGRTLVIFASDNGHLLGEHRGFGKTVGYEESARVPLVIRGPGMVPGVGRDQLVSLADLTSTIAEAAGAGPTLVQDGRPLQDLSADAATGVSRPMLLEAGPESYTSGQRLYTGIRTPDGHSLLRWHTGDVELYDLQEDPFQLDGTISGTESQAERDELLRRLDALEDCAGASCQ